jgi:hypothetical protein
VREALLPYCGGVLENESVAKHMEAQYSFRIVARLVLEKDSDKDLPERPDYWITGVKKTKSLSFLMIT